MSASRWHSARQGKSLTRTDKKQTTGTLANCHRDSGRAALTTCEHESTAKVVEGAGIVRIYLEEFLVKGNRLAEASLLLPCATHVEEAHLIVRLQGERLGIDLKSL